MFPADISADTDTDILGRRYRPPIPIPIFSLNRYLADNRSKGRYKPIFWPISRIFNRYLADTDIADIYLADTDTDTDMPIPISSLPIPIYRYRYRPNISANRYIGLSLHHIQGGGARRRAQGLHHCRHPVHRGSNPRAVGREGPALGVRRV